MVIYIFYIINIGLKKSDIERPLVIIIHFNKVNFACCYQRDNQLINIVYVVFIMTPWQEPIEALIVF